MSGKSDAVHFLLNRNPASLEAKDQEGRTALHLASGHRLGSDATLTALLAAGANMEAKTCLGETPLLKACKALRVSAVQILLRWGADEAAVDADGRNPTAMVLQMLQSQHPGVFRDMLEAILQVLACAPADRAWRRRGWLLMARYSSRRQNLNHAGDGRGLFVLVVFATATKNILDTSHPRGAADVSELLATRNPTYHPNHDTFVSATPWTNVSMR